MTKFKTGDCVRIKDEYIEYANQWGLAGVLTVDNPDLLGYVSFVGSGYVVDADRLEPVETAKPAAPTIDIAKQYRTRDGREVRILCTDGPDANYPVIAVYGNSEIGYAVDSFTAAGLTYADDVDDLDLIEAKPERTGWINVYSDSGRSISNVASRLHSTKESANYGASGERIACIRVTFREGDGL